MANGYWINVRATDYDGDTLAEGKVFLFSHGRDRENFIYNEIECRGDYDVDWDLLVQKGYAKELPSTCDDGLCDACWDVFDADGLDEDEWNSIQEQRENRSRHEGECWSGGMSWSHDITEGDEPAEIGACSDPLNNDDVPYHNVEINAGVATISDELQAEFDALRKKLEEMERNSNP